MVNASGKWVVCASALLVTVLCFGMAGCGPSRVTDAGLVGTWVADTDAGAQTIVLSENHRYTQVIDRGHETRIREGAWAVGADGAEDVILRDALLFNVYARTVPAWTDGDWRLRARGTWSGLHLDGEGVYQTGFSKSANPDRRPPG